MAIPHIVIAGGGYVGMYTALGLQKACRSGEPGSPWSTRART